MLSDPKAFSCYLDKEEKVYLNNNNDCMISLIEFIKTREREKT
jgi:hypothetical protein